MPSVWLLPAGRPLPPDACSSRDAAGVFARRNSSAEADGCSQNPKGGRIPKNPPCNRPRPLQHPPSLCREAGSRVSSQGPATQAREENPAGQQASRGEGWESNQMACPTAFRNRPIASPARAAGHFGRGVIRPHRPHLVPQGQPNARGPLMGPCRLFSPDSGAVLELRHSQASCAAASLKGA
jgi:hypothetical protein